MSTGHTPSTDPSIGFVLPEDRLYKTTRVILKWLQGLFACRPAGNFKYSNSIDTEIVITDQYPKEIESKSQRPFIVTTRYAAGSSPPGGAGAVSPSLFGQSSIITTMVSVPYVIKCCSTNGVEAQNLAYFVFRMLPVFRSSIIAQAGLHAITPSITIYPEANMDKALGVDGWTEVSVGFTVMFQENISMSVEGLNSVVRAVESYIKTT